MQERIKDQKETVSNINEEYTRSLSGNLSVNEKAANIVNGVKSLSFYHDAGDLEYNDTIVASYQYEVIFLPGEPDITKNWKFTAASSAGISNQNPSFCRIYNVSSNTTFLSTTLIDHYYTFDYDLGFFTEIAGIPVWIRIGSDSMDGNRYYSIGLVQ